MITQSEWQRNLDTTIDYLDSISANRNPLWISALRSASRVARDFNRNVKVMWNGTEYHIYAASESCFGNFDICLPDGHIIH